MKELEFGDSLDKATKYIVDNAQGVFIWVELIGKKLKEYDKQGRPRGDIFRFLKSLPKELEDVYKHMLGKMQEEEENIPDGIKIFRFVLFAGRPLTISELLHALRIPDDLLTEFTPLDNFFESEIPEERYITHCGGNFLETKGHDGIYYRILQGIFKLVD